MRRRFVLSLLLVPVFNAVYLVASSRSLAWSTLVGRIQAEAALIGFTLRAVVWGRYPTAIEMLRTASPLEYVLSALLCWWVAAVVIFLIWSAGHYRLGLLPPTTKRWLAWGLSLITVVIVGAWGLSRFFQPTLPEQAQVTIDLNAVMGPMPVHAHSFSQGGESEMRQPGYFEQAVTALQPIGPRFIRIDHLFDYYDVFQLSAKGRPIYYWTELDRVVDAIRASGAQPLLCLSYLPPALARGNVYAPPVDWAQWEELVYQTVRHFNVERQLGIVYWEVWNEPNVPSFWDGTLDEYLRLYEVTARGARRADPTVQLGGPATASLDPGLDLSLPYFEQNWIGELARFTQAHNLPLDFVSWHYYDAQPANYAWSVQIHQGWLADRGLTPRLWLTEWNRSSSFTPELDSEVTAAYAAATLTTLAETAVEQSFFFEPLDSSLSWEGHWGMMRKDGVLKPVYYTFSLASRLNGERVTATSNVPDVGALASRNGDQIDVLVWHSGQQTTSPSATLSLTGLPTTTLTYSIWGVDAEHGNLYRNPAADNVLIESATAQLPSAGRWSMALELPPNSVRLVEITRHQEK